MTIEQLRAEVLKLPTNQRAEVAEALISSLDEAHEIEQAWVQEAERRYQDYLAGKTDALPAAEALARIRAGLER